MDERELDALVDCFEEAWRDGEHPDVAAFLEKAPAGHDQLLVDLVNIDLEFRLKSGQSIEVESYFERFPKLASDLEASLDLIEAEFSLRSRRTPGLSVDEYCRRFPDFAAILRARLAAGDPQQELDTISTPGSTLPGGPCAGNERSAKILQARCK